ncbi:beta strand repeat-containing protein [Singulisphaera acidiphila]|uniref:PKD domain-containing protein n=1 Tax=Singulisphaera acidiphila (strain ATCC BAA-1392 / DSM 18658 / VKM B-2454 / MOB10) TaxID=886293 RepID=L0DNJ8_SINAD|nr:hypothetical protein [Singulisphaera acidiphila]AGA30390.1 hypothetical protein Sinac_6304 [Singulisphaera acidiphila DSM 18658]
MLSFYDWRNNPSEWKSLKRERPRRVLGHGAMFETLERRCLLSFLDITASSTSAAGPLTYVESTGGGATNELSIVSTGVNGNYTVVDQFQTISLSESAISLGWTGDGTNSVTGPVSSVTRLAISSSNAQVNNLTIGSIDAPTVVTGFDAVNAGTSPTGGPSTLQGIRQPLTIGVQLGQTTPTSLTLDDSGGTVGRNWTIAPASVSGASPSPINWTSGQVGQLNIRGGSGGDSFTVNDTSAATRINPGAGSDSLAILGTTNALVIDESGASPTAPIDSVRVALGPAIGGALSFLGSSRNTNLILDGTNSTADARATLAQGGISGLTQQPILFGTTSLSQISYLGGSGADTLTVDFSGGNPIPSVSGILYNGNAGFNTLVLMGGSFTDEMYGATNSTDGFISLDDSRIGTHSSIQFLNLSPIIDTVPATNFTFVSPSSAVVFNVIDGPISQGFQTTEINSGDTPVGFERIDFANKTNVQLDLTRDGSPSGAGERITLNTTKAAVGLASLTILSSESADQINILATAPGVSTSINSGGNNDQFTVLPSGLGAGGSLFLNGGTGTDTLNIDAGGGTVNFTGTTVNIGAFPTINLANIEQVNITNAANPPLSAIPTTISGFAGYPLSNTVVGQFSDADVNEPASQFTATINWGDGTSTQGVVSQAGGAGTPFDVIGTHTFANPGSYPVSILVVDQPYTSITTIGGVTFAVSDVGGGSTTIASRAEIASPDIVVTPLPITVTEDYTFTKSVALITPSSGYFTSESGFTAVIDWGDGTAPSAGTIVPEGEGSFLVNGSHLYLRETAPGLPYIVTVMIRDPQGVLTTVKTTATVLSNDIVTTDADSGPGSLRAVIEDVNADQIPTTIIFRIPGAGPHRITLLSPLPVIAYSVFIDGSSQPGFQGEPLIEIDGSRAGAGANGLTLAGGNSTVQSLVINGFAGIGLLLEGIGGNRVVGNRIGTDLSGTQAVGNGNGIQIQNIDLNTIGGLTPAERNIISGNRNIGINLVGSSTMFNRVWGNYIGTDVTGTASVPNFQGVVILGAARNLIGGDAPGMGNLISGNASVGIQIFNDATVFNGQPMFNPPGIASGNVIQGNFIGTNAQGTDRLGNAQGIFINDASGNLIGGSTPGAGNVVAGNRSIGVQILGDNATSNALLGNFIGTNRAGARGLGNTFGVFLYSGPGNFMAPSSSPNGNDIRFNTLGGVQVRELSEGPQVERVGLLSNPSAGTITAIGLTFTTYLDSQRALNPANYIVTAIRRNSRPGARIPVASVLYDDIYRIVTLTFASPLPRNTAFRLRVIGTAPGGLTDRAGNFLDGNNGEARVRTGSDYQTTFVQGVQVQTAASVASSPARGGRRLLQRRARKG